MSTGDLTGGRRLTEDELAEAIEELRRPDLPSFLARMREPKAGKRVLRHRTLSELDGERGD